MSKTTLWIAGAIFGALTTACSPDEPPPAAQQATDRSSWVDLAAHNIGQPINTMWSEGELAFADDGTMVFTSSRQDLAVAPGDPKDLYIATFNEETGQWNMPVNMGFPVNAPPATHIDPLRLGDDREPWITPDGNTIFFKSDRLATSDPRNANDVFVTHRVDGEWSEPELVPFPVSTDAGNEHCPMLLQDGQTLCFASSREGGYGGSDIWCSRQDESGAWQDPVNQGPNINTAAQEFHFMQAEDGSVYFTSDRPGGFGGMDIWVSARLTDGTGPDAWGLAENLGPLVNTPSADMCPAFSAGDETMAWFSSRADNNWGAADIFWTYRKTPEIDP
jgi:hypothetical protein